MSEHILTVTDTSFENDVLNSELPVLVDFWAEWCGPCRMIGPILEEIAQEYHGKIKVAKINVDENRTIPAKYNVRGIPTLLIIKNGHVEDTSVGALGKAQMVAFVDKNL